MNYLPVAAWHLIRRMALKHPPKVIGVVAGLFLIYAVMGRLRSGRWIDSILLSLITTAVLVFVAACLYILFTHPGYHLLKF
jgi:hypothetical protein